MARSENNLNAVFTDTASAIRAKTGTTETICPIDFADKINSIETGGSGMKAYFEAGGKCGWSDAKTFDGVIKYSDTENVKDLSALFRGCKNLKNSVNIDMRNATDIAAIYRECDKLESADITTSARDMNWAFVDCYNIKSINIVNTNNTNNVTCERVAGYCNNIKTVNINAPKCWDFGAVCYYSGVVSANLGQLHKQTKEDAHSVDYGSAFKGCKNLEEVTLDIGSVYTTMLSSGISTFINLRETFYGVQGSTTRTKALTINFLNADSDVSRAFAECFRDCDCIESLPAVNCINSYGLDSAFIGCVNLKELNFYNITDNIKLNDCTKMTRDALVEVLNNLATVTSTKTCTLGATNLAKLTDEDKAIATNKGWTLL